MSSLGKAINILEGFSAERPMLGVSEVARRLNLPKSSVARLFKEMRERGLVEQDPATRLYKPGQLAFRLGSLYQAHLHSLDLIETALADLVEQFGLTGYIGVMEGGDVIILRVRQGWYPVRMVLDAGVRIPAFATAIGRALLARWSDADVTRRYREPLKHDPAGLIMTLAELRAALDLIRRTGTVEIVNATYSGFGAVGAAVVATGEQPVAFSLSFPTHQPIEAGRKELVVAVRAAAQEIGRKVDDEFWTKADSMSKAAE